MIIFTDLSTTLEMTSGQTVPEEGDPKGGISRLAKMRKPQCTSVHEDFRIKRNAEITLLGRPLQEERTSITMVRTMDFSSARKSAA